MCSKYSGTDMLCCLPLPFLGNTLQSTVGFYRKTKVKNCQVHLEVCEVFLKSVFNFTHRAPHYAASPSPVLGLRINLSDSQFPPLA